MKPRSYYNEIDPYAAQWLRNLISAGLIPDGEVDERSITEVRAADLAGFAQCHFFAGIAGWSVALRLAGWPDDRPVWTGSCPCQPFSAAGAGKAADDSRHLWPAWFPLIAECKPAIIFGEQVEAAIGWGWLDAVFADLEQEGYACGTSVLPACSVGAPHIRQRCWFVANACGERAGWDTGAASSAQAGASRARRTDGIDGGHASVSDGADGIVAHPDGGNACTEGLQRSGQHGQRAQDGCAGEFLADAESRGQREFGNASRPRSSGYADGGFVSGELADPECPERWPQHRPCGNAGTDSLSQRQESTGRPRGDQQARELGNTASDGQRQPRLGEARGGRQGALRGSSAWSELEWLQCADGKTRPTQPGIFPLAHGVQRRTSKLRAYGNAIVPQVAAEFIVAALAQIQTRAAA